MSVFSSNVILPAVVAGATLAAGGVLGRGMFSPRSTLLGPVVWHGPRSGNLVALTFDDGPWPESTSAILDLLADAAARATFFVIGRYAREHPELLRRIVNEGHLIGNHTFDHHRSGLFGGKRYWLAQIEQADDAIAQIIGQRPALFRPPMGFRCPPMASVIRSRGHRVVTWSVRTRDGVLRDPLEVARRAAAASAGDIILMHDGRDPSSRRDVSVSVSALPLVLAMLRERGLRSVRIDELLTPDSPRPSPAPPAPPKA